MIVSESTLRAYNQSRGSTNKRLVCHAPSVNLNFEQTGEVRACCYNIKHVLGKWPEKTIKEIWTGSQIKILRDSIAENNLGGGCIECGRMIEAGNYQGVRAKYYDEFAGNSIFDKAKSAIRNISGSFSYPKVMEFELSNECNLECVMCNGSFSSSIRKNREKLPPISSPYNGKFVEQLDEFIPHLTDAKFLGGEPFMIDIYLAIWERIKKINPSIRIHITTNGTFLNNRVKQLLEGLNAGIILSIDTIEKETYQKIRVNGNYEKVMENLEYFRAYTARQKTFISIAACPIIYNWKEMPALLDFCLSKNIALYFNAVFTPHELSLREQTSEYLQEVITLLESHSLPSRNGTVLSPHNLSLNAYQDFLKLLKGWQEEKVKWNERVEEVYHSAQKERKKSELAWSLESIRESIAALSSIEGEDQFQQQEDLQDLLGNLLVKSPPEKLSEAMMFYIYGESNTIAQTHEESLLSKVNTIADMVNAHPKRNEILKQTAKASPAYFAAMIQHSSIQELKGNLKTFFST